MGFPVPLPPLQEVAVMTVNATQPQEKTPDPSQTNEILIPRNVH